MPTTILARVAGLLSHLVDVQADSLWLPRRTLNVADADDTAFDATDLVSVRQRTARSCCGGTSLIATLTR